MELLSPVGNREMLEEAIRNGADAVYLAGKNFGARKFANNFTNEELAQVIRYCHLYGVLVYVTANTIIFNDEREEFIRYLVFLYEIGVDAVIMQDMGMISLVRTLIPKLEIHASTQCHNHNMMDVYLMKKLGVKRVVLARELTLSEVRELSKEIDVEVFIHGALCMAYSGCCLFSSLNGGRSGNRGECVGSCRLAYKLVKDGKIISTKGDYLLSTRELKTLDKIDEVMESGAVSLKIEGRMKSPMYVGLVTRIYRQAIDRYKKGECFKVRKRDNEILEELFNRKFTTGYMFNDNVSNSLSPNHQGRRIGEVIRVNKRDIVMRLDDDIYQEDGIRFKKSNLGMFVNFLYDTKGRLINKGKKGEIVSVRNKIGLTYLDEIRRTSSKELERELMSYSPRKIGIKFMIRARIGNLLWITVSDGVNVVSLEGAMVERAEKAPITKARIGECLKKLGSTCYECLDISYEIDDNIFINIRDINEIRRKLIILLNEKRMEVKRDKVKICLDDICINRNELVSQEIRIMALVRNEEQLKAAIETEVYRIYVTDEVLYRKYKGDKRVYLRVDRVTKDKGYQDERLLVTEWGSAYGYASNNLVDMDYYLNIVNDNSLDLARSLGGNVIMVSPEVNRERLEVMDKRGLGVVIYGRIELMIMKYKLVSDNGYFLQDGLGKLYPILVDEYTHIMHERVIRDDIRSYYKMGVRNFRLEFCLERGDEVMSVINDYLEEGGRICYGKITESDC